MAGFAQHVYDRDEAAQGEQTRFKLAPLSQALQADQTRLALYADPNDPTKAIAGKEIQYDQTLSRMTQTIGQMRSILGQKPPSEDPNAAVSAGAGLLDKLHITNNLKGHIAERQSGKVNQYYDQNRSMAQEASTGALPYGMTTAGQAEAQKQKDALALAEARTHGNYQNFRGPNGEMVTVDINRQEPPAGYVRVGSESAIPKQTTVRDSHGNPVIAYAQPDGSFKDQEGKKIEGAKPFQKPTNPMMKAGTSKGRNTYAYYNTEQKSWIDSDTQQPLKDFRPLPTMAQTGNYGLDVGYDDQGNMHTMELNRRTGAVKQISGVVSPSQVKEIEEARKPALAADTQLNVMMENQKDALKGNQQAMLSLVANHIGMTLGQQKGARINQAVWNEAVASTPWLKKVAAKWSPEGYLSGVTLSPMQIDQMVGLAKQRRKAVWNQAQKTAEASGVNLSVPDSDGQQSSPTGPVQEKNRKAQKGTRKLTASDLEKALQ